MVKITNFSKFDKNNAEKFSKNIPFRILKYSVKNA
jgi:hypothetical protein